MKTLILSSVLLTAILGLGQESNIDVLHYQFQIWLNDQNDSIEGVAAINFRATKKTDAVLFDLTGNKGSKGMNVVSVVSNDPKKNRVRFSHNNNKIELKGLGLEKNENTAVIIHYKGVPADGLIISKTKYGRRSFFADNWPDRGRHWLPCHDDPADKASVEFIISAPDHYGIVANGKLINEEKDGKGFKTAHWKEDVPVSTKVMVIGVANFAVDTTGFVQDSIPVYSYVYPEDSTKGFYDFAQAKEILPFFIAYVGPYAYKKLANVQSKTTFGGLENANTIFYSEGSVKGDRSNEGLIAHEIAHQWFGNMATEKSFGHLWLSEGFATYFTILYMENKYGKDTASAMLQKNREQIISWSKRSDKPVIDTAEKNYMNLLNTNSYQKGGWVLHMLRQQIGDSLFRKAIRNYYAAYAGSVAGTEDLQREFEKISGVDLKHFFKQWLYTPGQPELDIQWKYDAGEKKVILTVNQLQREDFVFPLEVKLIYASGNNTKLIFPVDNRTKIFSVPVTEMVKSIEADPETKLLFTGKIREIR